jgi:uncharacterized protein YfaT (DUF1175 family)
MTALVIAGVVAAAGPVAAQQSLETKPFEAYSNSALLMRDSIVAVARAQIGTKYRLGGGTPEKGFDCSGLIQYVMSALRLNVPRTAKQQAKSGLAIKRDTSRLLPGDILTFGKGKKGSVSHVGIYVGDGREQRRRPRHRELDRPPLLPADQSLARSAANSLARRQHSRRNDQGRQSSVDDGHEARTG